MRNFDVQKFATELCRDKRNLEMFRYLVNNAYIRVVNYHNTNLQDAARFEAEIAYFAKHFSPVSLADIDAFFTTRKWNKEKPGLIPAIFEGFRSHYDVIAPILDRYNFRGWFYIPSFFMDVPVTQQLAYSQQHELDVTQPEMYPDGRFAMNWGEVVELSQRHEICCHTGNHFQISKQTPDEDMQREIVEAKRLLEAKIGRPVDVFCWLYGEEYNYNIRAHKFLEQAGYKYVLSNLKLEKIR